MEASTIQDLRFIFYVVYNGNKLDFEHKMFFFESLWNNQQYFWVLASTASLART